MTAQTGLSPATLARLARHPAAARALARDSGLRRPRPGVPGDWRVVTAAIARVPPGDRSRIARVLLTREGGAVITLRGNATFYVTRTGVDGL